MRRMKRYAFVLVTGVALGLLSAAVAFSQEKNGPPPGAPPHDGVGERAGPGAPDGDRDLDDGLMPPPRPEMRPGNDGPFPRGGPQGPGPGMQRGPDGSRPGGGMPMPPGDRGRGAGPMQEPFGMGMPPGGMMPHEMQRRDPEMFKLLQQDMILEQQSRELAMQCRGASKEDREKLKEQIVELVKKQFEVRQQRRSLELKRLEDELKRLREIVERRAKARKELIEKRVSELVGPEEPDVEF